MLLQFFTCSRTEASETWASVMYQWHLPFAEMKQNSPIFIASNSLLSLLSILVVLIASHFKIIFHTIHHYIHEQQSTKKKQQNNNTNNKKRLKKP